MTQQLRLSDGRVLDYKISGAQDGFPLLWIHGTPGAYTVFSDLEVMCREKGVKLITMSRAGYGSSTRQRGRCIIDVVPDLKQLTEHLNIKRCFVAGWSGGGKTTKGLLANYVTDVVRRTARPCLRGRIARMCRYSGNCWGWSLEC